MPRKSHHPFLSSLCAALVALLLFAVVSTGEAEDKDGLGADFWEKYDDITDWTTLRLNLTAVCSCSVIANRHLEDGGRILNISSKAGADPVSRLRRTYDRLLASVMMC